MRNDHHGWYDAPEPKNLCQYLWRIVLLTFPVGTLALIVLGFMAVVTCAIYAVWAIGSVLMIGVGAAWPTSHPFYGDGRTPIFWEAEPFRPVTVKDIDIPSWAVVVGLEVLGLLSLALWLSPSFRHTGWLILRDVGTGFLAMVLVAGFCYLAIALKRGLATTVIHSDSWLLFREGYQAWKDKHCPSVVVVRPVA